MSFKGIINAVPERDYKDYVELKFWKMAMITLVEYIAESKSKEEFFDKVMKKTEELLPVIDTETKANKLLKEIVLAKRVECVLDYSHLSKSDKEV